MNDAQITAEDYLFVTDEYKNTIDFRGHTLVQNLQGEWIEIPYRISGRFSMAFGDDGITFRSEPKE